MTQERKSLFIFLGSLFLCISFSAAAYYWDVPRNLFQEKTIPSPLLAYGETGKILRELGSISPVENKQISSRVTTNPVEFLQRAVRERDKWLMLSRFESYKNRGIFGYMEMESKEPAVTFAIEVKKNGSWTGQVSSRVVPQKFGYSFFIDSDGNNPELRFTFFNKEHPVHIHGMGFLKNGSHPLVFNDQVSLSSFFSSGPPRNIAFTESGAVIESQPQPDHQIGSLSFQSKTLVGISKYHKKQGSTPIDLIATRDHPLVNRLNIADKALAAISITKIPVLAIDIEDSDLYSEKNGILKNHDGHGREWERLGFVRLFKNGKPVFSTFSGIRLQGGDPGRRKGLINFRLYFREEYGTSHIKTDAIFDGSVKSIKRLAVKQSQWKQWPLNGPIAYDVTRKAGGLAPPTEICLLYLNGENLGLYYLVPHLGEKQIRLMLPDQNYQYFRIRGARRDADLIFFKSYIDRIEQPELMDERYATQFFDIENLVRLFFSYIINGTGDFCQGVLLRGSESDSKFFWYGWDFDHSFADVPVEITKTEDSSRHRWEQPPSFEGFLTPAQGIKPHHCVQGNLFKRLVTEDPEFREKTKHLFTSMVNHRVNEAFIAQLLDEYQQTLTAIDYPGGEEYINKLRLFFAERIPFLLTEMEEQYPTDPAVVCEVTSDNYPIVIDGYKKEGPYRGYYFPGSSLTVAPGASSELSYWRVNGTPEMARNFELSISSDQVCQIHGVR
jgi:hypothetical protein